MQGERVAPLVGIAGSLGVVVGLAYPYLAAEGPGVGSYYGTGAVSPLVAGLLAVLTVVVLAAGREGRTDPGMAAGVGLALGVAMVLITLLWSLTARIDTVAISEDHRWVLVGAAALVPLASAWYARALGLLRFGSEAPSTGD